jgi:hypothetical protein
LESPAFAVGQFTLIKLGSGSGLDGRYSFTVGKITYYSEHIDGRYNDLSQKIFRLGFPVIYNTRNPQLNQILVFPTDFSKFELSYPDSLKWTTAVAAK